MNRRLYNNQPFVETAIYRVLFIASYLSRLIYRVLFIASYLSRLIYRILFIAFLPL
jgi:hypothetical protein